MLLYPVRQEDNQVRNNVLTDSAPARKGGNAFFSF